jgi:hypothetical protein
MPKGLLIHNLKAGALDVELIPKLVSALGDVISAKTAGSPRWFAAKRALASRH